MKVITIATQNERMIDVLKESVINNGLKLDVYGMGRSYKHYGTKFIYIYEALEGIDDEEIVLFMDGFDTILLADEEEILYKYNNRNRYLTYLEKDLIFANGNRLIKNPLVKKCLLDTNSGLFIGKCSKIKRLFGKIMVENDMEVETSCDVILERYKNEFGIDDANILFYNYYFDGGVKSLFTDSRKKNELEVFNKRLYTGTNTKPIAIHFPKNSMNEDIISQLGYVYKIEKSEQGISYLYKDYMNSYFKYTWKYIIILILIIIIFIVIFKKLIKK